MPAYHTFKVNQRLAAHLKADTTGRASNNTRVGWDNMLSDAGVENLQTVVYMGREVANHNRRLERLYITDGGERGGAVNARINTVLDTLAPGNYVVDVGGGEWELVTAAGPRYKWNGFARFDHGRVTHH